MIINEKKVKKNSLHKFEYNLLKKLTIINQRTDLSPGKILLNLQISGGMDSMCLLHAFSKIINSKLFNTTHEFIIIVQHFNHKKRDKESDADAEFVLNTCLKIGIPFYQEILDSKTYLNKSNFQNEARQWRKKQALELCNHLKKTYNYNNFFIVTAHHARDHVESVLMHILRGCSLNGLTGIQEFDNQKIYYRPFYNIEYEELEKYCINENIKFRHDSSNSSNEYERNYIRNKILPHFKILKKTYEKSFCTMSNNIREHLEQINEAHQKSLPTSHKVIIHKNTTGSDIYKQLISKDKKFLETLSKNVVTNILHEIELLWKSSLNEKVIKLSKGEYLLLTKCQNNIEIEVSQKNC